MKKGRQRMKRLAIYWAGWLFIVLGVLGIFLPVLQGILFLFVGLLLLSNSSPRAARLLNYLRGRFPRLANKMHAAAVKAARIRAKIAGNFQSAPRVSGSRNHKQAERL